MLKAELVEVLAREEHLTDGVCHYRGKLAELLMNIGKYSLRKLGQNLERLICSIKCLIDDLCHCGGEFSLFLRDANDKTLDSPLTEFSHVTGR